MIMRSLIIVAALIAVVLVFAATKPDTFLIERSLSIKAPPKKSLRSSTTSMIGLDGRRRTGKTRP